MNLLERYLQSIKTFLPGNNQEDILLELRESLLSQFEERQQSLGRSLTEAEISDIIRDNGHPFLVAARYGYNRPVIGSGLSALYWQALKWSLIIALSIRLVIAVVSVLISAHPAADLLPALLAVPGVVIPVFAWTTAAFAGLEWALSYAKVKAPKIKWNPRSLPKFRANTQMIPRHQSAFAVIFGLAGVVWLRSVPGNPFLVLGPAYPFLAAGPVWSLFYGPLVALAVAGVLQAMVMLVRPDWMTFNIWSKLTLHLAALTMAYLLFRAGSWVVPAPGVHDQVHAQAIATIVNQALYYGFLATVVSIALAIAWSLYRDLRGRSTNPVTCIAN